VGLIPIHPRHFSAVLAAMTAKMTAKTTNGFLNRLRISKSQLPKHLKSGNHA
jgi:hypothetical protein